MTARKERKGLDALIDYIADGSESEITVRGLNSSVFVGGCNACTEKHTDVHEVVFRSLGFRVCRSCAERLVTALCVIMDWNPSKDSALSRPSVGGKRRSR